MGRGYGCGVWCVRAAACCGTIAARHVFEGKIMDSWKKSGVSCFGRSGSDFVYEEKISGRYVGYGRWPGAAGGGNIRKISKECGNRCQTISNAAMRVMDMAGQAGKRITEARGGAVREPGKKSWDSRRGELLTAEIRRRNAKDAKKSDATALHSLADFLAILSWLEPFR